MRVRGAVLLAGVLAGVALPLAAPVSVADPVIPPGATSARPVASATEAATEPAAAPVTSTSTPAAYRASRKVTARLHPPVVTVGEPSLLVAEAKPAKAGRELEVQRWSAAKESWVVLAEGATDKRGGFQHALNTNAPAEHRYRVVAAGSGRSKPVTSRVVSNTTCTPDTAPVDRKATGEAVCLLTRLDRWRKAGLMGVGQQLNVSNRDYLAPLRQLGDEPVAVIGFDLEELAHGETYDFPVPPVHGLLDLAAEGAVLSASWHTKNPFTGKVRFKQLLDPTSKPGRQFWADYDEKLELLARFSDGDEGRFPWTAVVFRPFHEANGNWFWWGDPPPQVFKKLWTRMQDRAWEAGVHNLVWSFSGNRVTSAAGDPRPLVPARVDLGGLDTYDPEKGKVNARDRLWLDGYAGIRKATPRMALTEVGPHGMTRKTRWNPSVVTTTVRKQGLAPLWALFWFDDGNGKDGVTGLKQIASLTGGTSWLRQCPGGLCDIR